MKTTLDLPDDLLIEAKAVAARRRTTLKEMVTRSLRREIGQMENASLPPGLPFVIGELGLPVLRGNGRRVTSEMVYQALEASEEADFQEARNPAGQS